MRRVQSHGTVGYMATFDVEERERHLMMLENVSNFTGGLKIGFKLNECCYQ